jgi:transposase
MWKEEQRVGHKVTVSKQRRGYPTDISDKEWRLVEPLLPGTARTGRPRKTELRQVINTLRYLVRSGCE